MPRVQALLLAEYMPPPVPVVAVNISGGTTGSGASTNPASSSWTTGAMPNFSNGFQSSWVDVAYSKSLSLFCAVADGGDNNNNNIATSPDGVTWTGRAPPNTNTWVMNAICWSPGLSLFCIVTSAGPTTSTRVLTSPDGVTWTARTIPDASKNLNAVAWSPELELCCAVGDSNYIVTSPDGATWTSQTGGGTSENWTDIVWAGNGHGGGMQKFVAIMNNTTSGLLYSSNGTAWTQSGIGGTRSPAKLAYSPALDIIAGVGGNTGFVAYTAASNVTSWSQQNSGLGSTNFNDICWSSDTGLFVAIENGPDTLTSPDGSTWAVNSSVIHSANWIGIGANVA